MHKLERYEGSGATPNLTQSHTYNGKGQRIRKTEGTSVRNYFYEDGSLSYATDGSENLKAFQLYDGNGSLFGTLRAGNLLYTYTSDLSGSITNVVDTDQSAVVSYTYNEFGETTETQGGTFDNEVRFNGGVYDESTGLYYLNARFYDPAVGRFLNPDSYRGEAADPQSLHLYAYCANDPVNYVDPTGHWVETALDIASFADSAYTFKKEPNLENFAFLALDTVAVAVPGVGGTWVLKALKAPKLKEVKAAGKVVKKTSGTVKRTLDGKRLTKVKVAKKTAKKESKKVQEDLKLLNEIALRAEKKVGGVGSVAGTKKHKYAQNMLDRYQRLFGDRGLKTEIPFKDGRDLTGAKLGSNYVRLDVYDTINNVAYDYKFTKYAKSGLSKARCRQLMTHSGASKVIEVNPKLYANRLKGIKGKKGGHR